MAHISRHPKLKISNLDHRGHSVWSVFRDVSLFSSGGSAREVSKGAMGYCQWTL